MAGLPPVASRQPVSSSHAVPSVKSSGSEAYYKSNLDLVLKENKQLKQKLDQLENENRDLKKSVYDLSVRHGMALQQLGKAARPFDIDSVFARDGAPGELLDSLLLRLGRSKQQGGGDFQGSATGQPGVKSNQQAADARSFNHKADFKGHVGSVYAVAFAPTAELLASGSFDQSVRVWDVQSQRELLCFQEHQLNVSDVCWSAASETLLSGGFDHCVKEWDVAAGRLLHSFAFEGGFVQAVRYNPAENNLFLVGTTAKSILVFDRRQRGAGAPPAMVMANDGKVNALAVYRDGLNCLSGDSVGNMKVWDLRTGSCVDSRFNEDGHKPITSMDVSQPLEESGEERGTLAVNSFDNVLRVYDHFTAAIPAQPTTPPLSSMRLAHAITGARNKNWTIRSSLYQGPEYRKTAQRRAASRPDSGGGGGAGVGEPRSRRSSEEPTPEVSLAESHLLVTGSADSVAFLYDISSPEGPPSLLQRLEGHTDRVCAAVFHPAQPLLATCSADFTVKLWAPHASPAVPAN